jgi:hypothetical protein
MSLEKALQVARFGGEKLSETYSKYERFLPAASFGAGIVFDLTTLGRIDQMSNIIQIGIYLIVIAGLLYLEAQDQRSAVRPPQFLTKVWRYRVEVTHFFLGSLLSAFTIFFLKSGTLVSSFLFLAIIAGGLVANEFSEFRAFGLMIRVVLFSLCLISYTVAVVPVFWGRIGLPQFLTALVAAAAMFSIFAFIFFKRGFDQLWIRKQVIYPFSATFVSFFLLYAIGAIPPVPLSLTHLGIYRSVERADGNYKVTYARPKWKFWQSGDQTFTYRAGERVFTFFSVFSPGGFKEKVQVRWLSYSAAGGWEKSDAVPVGITGGREQGYRGFAWKQAVKPGLWQVRIETNDGREIGRLSFEIVDDPEPASERQLHEELL